MTKVAVASPLRLASEAGQAVADRGGNAIDAALTTAAMLTVAYPHNCAIGGDMLALVREPDGNVTFINGSGRALLATDVDAVRREHDVMPERGPIPITVPGMVDGWATLATRGAALAWEQHFALAQSAAAEGVRVAPGLARAIEYIAPSLDDYPDLAAVVCPEGQPLREGQTMRQPELARTFGAIADAGRDALYSGALSDAFCAGLNAAGVPITRDDLSGHHAQEVPPLTLDIGEWTLYAATPNSQAYLVLRLLGMLDAVRARGGSSRLLHRAVSAAELAAAFRITSEERDDVVAEPETMTIDINTLLTPDSLAELARSVTGGGGEVRAVSRPAGDTAAIVAADDEGRSVSLIQSLYNDFGSLIMEPSTGILMHDRGNGFSLDPASPNVLAPGKRPMHTLSPALGQRRGSDERLVVGTMGGRMQGQILTQVVSHLLDGASAADAVGAPRMTFGPWEDDDPADGLNVESDVGDDVLAELGSSESAIKRLPRHSSEVGHSHAICVRGGTMDTAADPRSDG